VLTADFLVYLFKATRCAPDSPTASSEPSSATAAESEVPAGTSLSAAVALDGSLLAVGESGAQRVALNK